MPILFFFSRILFLLVGGIIFLGGVWELLGAWGEMGRGHTELATQLLLLGLLGLFGGLFIGYLGSRLIKRWTQQK